MKNINTRIRRDSKSTIKLNIQLPSREALIGPTNSVNSISSSAFNTSLALIVCLFDSLHISLALHAIDQIIRN